MNAAATSYLPGLCSSLTSRKDILHIHVLFYYPDIHSLIALTCMIPPSTRIRTHSDLNASYEMVNSTSAPHRILLNLSSASEGGMSLECFSVPDTHLSHVMARVQDLPRAVFCRERVVHQRRIGFARLRYNPSSRREGPGGQDHIANDGWSVMVRSCSGDAISASYLPTLTSYPADCRCTIKPRSAQTEGLIHEAQSLN